LKKFRRGAAAGTGRSSLCRKLMRPRVRSYGEISARLVAGEDPDAVLAHLAEAIGEHLRAVRHLDAELADWAALPARRRPW